MKAFEFAYLCCEPGLPVIYKRIRKMLKDIARNRSAPMRILDVGGRKSHYTIGVPASITITDLPRCHAIQDRLNLGFTNGIISQLQQRRSNVERVVIDDMTRSSLSTATFDCAVAVEVLEHVESDQQFVREVSRVLKPGGVFVMTTPNGEWVTNRNPDHKRHYRREQLRELLNREFDSVEVQYAIPSGKYYSMALHSWSIRRPLRTMKAMIGSFVNAIEDGRVRARADGRGMQLLVAVARRAN